MKIVYLINGMFNSAGRERVVANKAKYFSELGHQITIITTDQKNKCYYYQIPAIVKTIDLSINYDEYAGFNIVKKVLLFRQKDELFKKRISEFFKNDPQDVVITLEDRFIPTLVQLQLKEVLVAESHFNKFALNELGKSVNRGIIQKIVYNIRSFYVSKIYYKKLDCLVVLTKEDMRYYNGMYTNIACIPNSINYDIHKCAPLENKVIVSVGRLTYQKGYDRLIKAWQIVSQKCPDWKLHIYGDGEDKDMLLNLISSYHLLDSVSIFPPTPLIEEKLLESSAFVLSSRFEGLPMVLLEAMSIGLPVVSYDCKTGPKDIITDGCNGFLVKEGDIIQLAAKVEELLIDVELRVSMGKHAKEASQYYSHEVIAQKWIDIFSQLMEKHNVK